MGLVAIDPGVRRCACVAFDMPDNRLIDAFFVHVKDLGETGGTALFRDGREVPATGLSTIVVIEKPQFDARSRTVPVQTLIGLAWSGALVAGALAYGGAIFGVTPSTWKGSEYKPQHHARLWEELTAEERRTLGGVKTADAIYAARQKGALDHWSKPSVSYYSSKFDTHNLLDAAALGAWRLGRLPRV